MKLFQPRQRKAGVDHEGGHAQRGADAGVQARARQRQQHLPVAGQHHGNRRQVEYQKALHPARQVKHFPFAPVGGVDLMQDQA